jgi:hypothetical protein
MMKHDEQEWAGLTLMGSEAAIDGWVTMPQVAALVDAMRAGRPWTDEERSTFWRIHHAELVRNHSVGIPAHIKQH